MEEAPTSHPRYKKYNEAHKEARKARRSKSADICIRRTHVLWKRGAFDIDVVRPLLPANGRLIGYRTISGASVKLYDGASGDIVVADFVRMANIRSLNGYFALCRHQTRGLIASPIWACFRANID